MAKITDDINNIYCVGRNYGKHAEELGNAVPESPMIFMKPTHALVAMEGQPITLPGSFGKVHYETELVIRIGAAYEPGMKASELIDAFALGIDFTLREVQDELKKKQHPWLKAKGFRSSAPITPLRPISAGELSAEEFSLQINGQEKQRGHIRDMIFGLQTLIDHIGAHYGLAPGDLIFTGTPAGVGQIEENDRLQLYWGSECYGECTIHFA